METHLLWMGEHVSLSTISFLDSLFSTNAGRESGAEALLGILNALNVWLEYSYHNLLSRDTDLAGIANGVP